MRIKQIYVSPALSNFENRMHKRYGLTHYTDPYQPAILYGMFKAAPKVILDHRSLAVVLWAGSDTLNLLKAYSDPQWEMSGVFKEIAENPNYYHICRSKCLQEDLDTIRLQYKFVRVSPTIPSYFPLKPLGSAIYCYGAGRKPKQYGGDWIEKLKLDFPDLRFRSHCLEHETQSSYEKMNEIYAKCFLGLRLTTHDGLPNTVLELGLMGRRCVFNGDLPNAISYKTYDDVKRIIKEERKKVGGPGNLFLSGCIRNVLDISDSWLDTDWY